MDWRQKGRDRASRMIEYASLFTETPRADAIRITAERASKHENWLREHFADLLSAVRWAISELPDPLGVAAHNAAFAEAEALALLVEGFRERLTELATGAAVPGKEGTNG